MKLAFEDGRFLLPLLPYGPYLSSCAVRIGVALLFTIDSGRAEQGCTDDRGGCSVVVAVLDFAVDLAAATFFLGPSRLWRRHRSRSRGWRNHRSRPWNWRGSWRHVSRLVLALRLFAGLAPAGRRVDGTGVELAPCRAFLHSEFNCRARGIARAGCSAVEIGFASCCLREDLNVRDGGMMIVHRDPELSSAAPALQLPFERWRWCRSWRGGTRGVCQARDDGEAQEALGS